MKLFTVVGARPNFIKLDPTLPQTIVHTGQHYDQNMSGKFFEELGLPEPAFNLGCNNEVGKMVDRLRELYRQEKPDLILVYGDTHSSLAGALAGAYEKIPVAHAEAGMRSFTNMPEEINRKLIDHIATVNLCVNEESLVNLQKEGLDGYLVGDPMFDTLNRYLPIKKTANAGKYILITIHREDKDKKWLQEFMKILEKTNEQYIFPRHPRLKGMFKAPKNVKIIPPQPYKKMLSLEANAKKIITDSGGVQKEGSWFNVPVILMRKETEWKDLVSSGKIKLADLTNVAEYIETFKGVMTAPPLAGANKRIKEIIAKYI